MNDYYVYIYWRLDINEPFYVGMGHNDRWKDVWRRNNHFKNIINKHPIAVEIVKDNLTKEQAHGIECWLINELVFEYGFSIEIKENYYQNNHYCHLVNCTWGGEGISGCNPREGKTEKELDEWNEKISKANKGRNPYANKTEEEMEIIRKKMSINISGKNNPNYKKPIPKERKERISESLKGRYTGKDSPNAKSVICLTTKRIFYAICDACKFYNIKTFSHISNCCKGYYISKGKKFKVKSAGKLPDGTPLVWRKIVWNHGKKYRIKSNN